MNYCCGANYFKDGDEIKLKNDDEYPDWLWKLPLKTPRLHELDPQTKEYWERAEIVGRQRELKLYSLTKQKKHLIVGENLIKREELRERRKFRALAKFHYNAGNEIVKHHERMDTWNLHLKEKFKLADDPKPYYPGLDCLDLKSYKFYQKKDKNFVPKIRANHFGC
ncbi:39S ribosomal protein L54, mitochondrial-like protein [Sarcoptes scabiei]|nr:39S ribosomal protein L54, mitochondrial-like protein [Sarcoptes scabiei]